MEDTTSSACAATSQIFSRVCRGETGTYSDAPLIRQRHETLPFAFSPSLADVDRPEDLAVVEQAWGKTALQGALESLSVIIPALNEAGGIETTLASIRRGHRVAEVIVVDGGSTDGTPEKARAAGAQVLVVPGGRARQMNAGAARAAGGILLFLHADTQLPDGFDRIVRKSLREAGVIAGAFAFSLDDPSRSFRHPRTTGELESKPAPNALRGSGGFHQGGYLSCGGRFPGHADHGGLRVYAPPAAPGPDLHCAGSRRHIRAAMEETRHP